MEAKVLIQGYLTLTKNRVAFIEDNKIFLHDITNNANTKKPIATASVMKETFYLFYFSENEFIAVNTTYDSVAFYIIEDGKKVKMGIVE
jgi:hypothetical protein